MPDGSLRERKRARLQRNLLDTAVSLFRDRGFSATPVRAILDRVEISEATFFNHFPTKDSLLAAWAAERLAALVRPASGPAGPGGLGAGVRATVRSALRRLGEGLEAEGPLARDAWTRLRVGGPERAAPWRPLLEAGQARGELREDLPADELARILAAALDAELARWAETEASAGPPLAQRLQRAADLVLDGSRKRHERVRASSRAARPPSPAPPSGHRRL